MSPVLVSILATITVSVRVPSRPAPSSAPSSSRFSRGVSAQGSFLSSTFGRVALLELPSEAKTLPTRSRWAITDCAATVVGTAMPKQSRPTNAEPASRPTAVRLTGRSSLWEATTIQIQSRPSTTTRGGRDQQLARVDGQGEDRVTLGQTDERRQAEQADAERHHEGAELGPAAHHEAGTGDQGADQGEADRLRDGPGPVRLVARPVGLGCRPPTGCASAPRHGSVPWIDDGWRRCGPATGGPWGQADDLVGSAPR